MPMIIRRKIKHLALKSSAGLSGVTECLLIKSVLMVRFQSKSVPLLTMERFRMPKSRICIMSEAL